MWRILITFYLFYAIILISELLELLDLSGICVNCPEAGCSVVFSNVLWLCPMFTVKLILSGDGVQDCGVSDAVSQGFLSPLQLVSTVSGLCAWLTQPDSLLLSSTSTNLSSLFYKLHYRLLLLISYLPTRLVNYRLWITRLSNSLGSQWRGKAVDLRLHFRWRQIVYLFLFRNYYFRSDSWRFSFQSNSLFAFCLNTSIGSPPVWT